MKLSSAHRIMGVLFFFYHVGGKKDVA